jgi:hypothetical protein
MKDCFGRYARPAIAPANPFGYLVRRLEGVLVSLARGKSAPGTRRAWRGLASFRSPLAAFVVALSLIAQLIAMPYQEALAGPVGPGADTAAIAADLNAVFGDAAGFCAHIGDKGAPSPQAPCNRCDGQCPLCRIVAEAATLMPPDAPALPAPVNSGRYAIGAAPDFGAFATCLTQSNRARAPPLAV